MILSALNSRLLSTFISALEQALSAPFHPALCPGWGQQQGAALAELHQWAPWTIWLPGQFTSENPGGRRTVKPVCIPLALSSILGSLCPSRDHSP